MNELSEKLFSHIRLPAELDRLVEDPQQWIKFCQLPYEIKNKYHKETASAGNPNYVSRSTNDNCIGEYLHASENRDNNSLFFNSEKNLFSKYSEIRELHDYVNTLQPLVEKTLVETATVIAKGIPTLSEILHLKKYSVLTRFLHYLPTDETDILSQHYDRGMLSMHLYENAPGLEYLDKNMKWEQTTLETKNSLIFCGNQMEILSDGKLQKLWHRIKTPAVGFERYSIVSFLWSEHLPQQRGSKTNKPSYN